MKAILIACSLLQYATGSDGGGGERGRLNSPHAGPQERSHADPPKGRQIRRM